MAQMSQFWLFWSFALLLGCAGGPVQTGPVPSSPFTETDRPLFDDGIDFMADPAGLAGRWLAEFEKDLQGRVSRSDIIAEVRIDAVGTELDPEGRTTYVLTATPIDVLKGNFSAAVSLGSEPSSAGYFTIERAKTRLLKEHFFVFVKWHERSEGLVEARFHLSPAAEPLKKEVHRALFGARRIIRVIR